MSGQRGNRDLPEPRRREIFRMLVGGQDLQMGVAESSRMVCEHFGVNEGLVRQIEEEGLEGRWPPPRRPATRRRLPPGSVSRPREPAAGLVVRCRFITH